MTLTRGGHELSVDRLADELTEPWKPVDVAVVNGAVLRLVRPAVHLEAGEMYVVKRGHRHPPVAEAGPAYALLVERPETKQYGEEGTH